MLMSTCSSCATYKHVTVTYVLPPEPQREEQKKPENLDDVVNLALYYEYLIQEWEEWAQDVKKIVTGGK